MPQQNFSTLQKSNRRAIVKKSKQKQIPDRLSCLHLNHLIAVSGEFVAVFCVLSPSQPTQCATLPRVSFEPLTLDALTYMPCSLQTLKFHGKHVGYLSLPCIEALEKRFCESCAHMKDALASAQYISLTHPAGPLHCVSCFCNLGETTIHLHWGPRGS